MAIVPSDLQPATVECSSWEAFCSAIRAQDGAPLDPLYRGHARVEWALVGPSERESYRQARQLEDRGIEVAPGLGPAARGQVQYFTRLATGMPFVNLEGLSEIDIEALARHHGLCSNLLDWTVSPYVAAFFAFTTALDLVNSGRLSSGTISNAPVLMPTNPVCVWRISNAPDLAISGEFEVERSLSARNYWQKAQSGVFTRLTHSRYVDLESYFRHRSLLSRICRFVVPGNQTGRALHDLEQMNITFATLFPDLKGAAMQANIGMTWRLIGA
jgi:hypothetical protein